MKLVDILAREMKEWPFTERRLGQACDGSLHAEPFTGGHTVELYTLADDYREAVVSRSQWQAAVDALKAGEQVWDGEGLPPVGIYIEIRNPLHREVRAESEKFIGQKVRSAAVFRMSESGIDMVAVDGGSDLGCEVFRADMAFPVRTAEQIAAEERAKVIGEMIDIYKSNYEGLVAYGCQALYDAGYRKQEVQQ